jgi:hypothetical protein
VTLHLTIKNSNTADTTVTACNSFNWYGKDYTKSGDQTHIFTTTAGCDSVVTLHLTVISIDTSVTSNALILTSNQANANYQWLDCNNGYLPINGETNQVYSVNGKGSYAVVITKNMCSDTSKCIEISPLEAIGVVNEELISIYPNPNSGVFNLNTPVQVSVIITNSLSQIIYSKNISEGHQTIDLGSKASGVYFVKAQNGKQSKIYQLIISR